MALEFLDKTIRKPFSPHSGYQTKLWTTANFCGSAIVNNLGVAAPPSATPKVISLKLTLTDDDYQEK